ncbi:MAG: hypothetical protein HYV36_08690 [Lentisphaerae bacterium]|nr:hypothetical protein [Lentisphaerota bacterium]
MLNPDEIKMIDKGWLTLNIVWLAMISSLVIYLLLGLYLDHVHFSIGKEFPINILRKALYAVSIIIVILAKYIRKYMLETKQARGVNRKSQPLTVSNQHPAVIKYAKAVILSLVLSESAGLFGLILFVLGHILTDLYIMLAISAAALLYYRPHKEELLNLANSLKNHRIDSNSAAE